MTDLHQLSVAFGHAAIAAQTSTIDWRPTLVSFEVVVARVLARKEPTAALELPAALLEKFSERWSSPELIAMGPGFPASHSSAPGFLKCITMSKN